MGMISKDVALAIEEPALNSLWRFRVPFAESDVHVFAESVSVTWPKIPTRPRSTSGSNTYYPETMDIDGISAVFYETQKHDVTRWFYSWQNLVCDANGNYGVPYTYKKEGVIDLFSRLDMTTPILTLRYSGLWPTDKGAYQLSFEDGTGRLTVEVQFSTDSLEMVYN